MAWLLPNLCVCLTLSNSYIGLLSAPFSLSSLPPQALLYCFSSCLGTLHTVNTFSSFRHQSSINFSWTPVLTWLASSYDLLQNTMYLFVLALIALQFYTFYPSHQTLIRPIMQGIRSPLLNIVVPAPSTVLQIYGNECLLKE